MIVDESEDLIELAKYIKITINDIKDKIRND